VTQLPQYNRDLQVRPIAPDELSTARLLAGRAFGEDCQTWFGDTCLAGFDVDGRMVCVLDYDPASMWWGTASIPAAAIGGVATDPEHQSRGHAGGLMVQTIHLLREQGRCVCPLWPFSFAWYGKFGWSCPATVATLRLWPDLVRRTAAAVGTVRAAVADDEPEIDRLYTACAQSRNCQSVRTASSWQEKRWLGEVWVLEGAADGLACSALVSIRPVHRGQGKKVVVREFHGVDLSAQLSLVRSLAELDDVSVIELNVPPDSLFLHAFAERISISAEHELALRVLDVPQALSHLQPPADLQACVSFEVADWVVDPERPQTVTVRASNGAVELLDSHSQDPFRCDIRTFTQLFAGGLCVTQARKLNRLEGGNAAMAAACDALLYGRMPYRSGAEAG
jgi:predicted acetyltransferase